MFTGIVAELGTIKSIDRKNIGKNPAATFCVYAKALSQSLQIDDSVSVNGVCQTVTSINRETQTFTFDAISTTFLKTTHQYLSVGKEVNLEEALKLSTPIGGHLVSGHVQTTIELHSKHKQDLGEIWRFKANTKLLPYIMDEGSVCIDGVSLTVACVHQRNTQSQFTDRSYFEHSMSDDQSFLFDVHLIPHTVRQTCFKNCVIGQKANFEPDLLMKYFVHANQQKQALSSKGLLQTLKENGF